LIIDALHEVNKFEWSVMLAKSVRVSEMWLSLYQKYAGQCEQEVYRRCRSVHLQCVTLDSAPTLVVHIYASEPFRCLFSSVFEEQYFVLLVLWALLSKDRILAVGTYALHCSSNKP
jgi:hypothetical protein